jgi:hypothetical protein
MDGVATSVRDMPGDYWHEVTRSPTVRPVDAERTAEESAEEPAPSRRATPTPRARSAARRTTELRTGDRRTDQEADPGRRTTELPTGDRPTDPEVDAEGHTGDVRTGDLRPGDYGGAEVRPVPTNIYRARRPAVAILLIIPAVGVGLLLIRALAIAAFGDPFLIGGVIASACALASLPLLVAGLYGLVTGASHGAEHYGFKVWARPPLAYLLVGLAFVLAAGLAIR